MPMHDWTKVPAGATVNTSKMILLCLSLVIASGNGCRNGNKPTPSNNAYPKVAPDDPSILLEEPFRVNTGVMHSIGMAFDSANIDLKDAKVVWLPSGEDVSGLSFNNNSPSGHAILDLQIQWHDASHVDVATDIRVKRKAISVKVATFKDTAIIRIMNAGSGRHSSLTVAAIVQLPQGVQAKRGEPEETRTPLDWEAITLTPVPVPPHFLK